MLLLTGTIYSVIPFIVRKYRAISEAESKKDRLPHALPIAFVPMLIVFLYIILFGAGVLLLVPYEYFETMDISKHLTSILVLSILLAIILRVLKKPKKEEKE